MFPVPRTRAAHVGLATMDKPAKSADKFRWLPEAIEHVAFRLARSDECAFKIGDLSTKWSLDGPVGFEQVRRGEQVQLFVKSLRPVPPEVALLFSEAVNHLRASIDNVIWYLVEQEHGHISGSTATLVSMPIQESQETMGAWTNRRLRKIPAFGPDTQLGRRLRILQPYVDLRSGVPSMGEVLAAVTGQEVESAHPLRLLQAYSNADKHRSIRVALPRTFTSTDATSIAMQNLAHQELKVGDPLGPPTLWGQLSIRETNTAMMVQRPGPFSAWVNPVKELNAMRRHVCDIVLPILLTGLEMPNGLPPVVHLGDNGLSNRERLAAGEWEDADARLIPLIQARFLEAEGAGVQFVPVVDQGGTATP